VRELLDLAIDVATLRFRKLIGGRELANSELLASLRENQTARFNCEHVEIHLDVAMENVGWLKPFLASRRPPQTIRETIVQKFFQRAMPKGDRDELLN